MKPFRPPPDLIVGLAPGTDVFEVASLNAASLAQRQLNGPLAGGWLSRGVVFVEAVYPARSGASARFLGRMAQLLPSVESTVSKNGRS
ncbi:hypothetical protein E3C22_19320 [Jiella endophytica]|uniref:Uncharacterized protein n=1 Tax=Jiella endophytica TaxID=2558362 RepID=A0A4Y8RED0_9HYPH|nr:hypothetical protein [Jiella endophytica]TFF19826.1 hypothetical protein E3C22_19320 [Jiella endophytica]